MAGPLCILYELGIISARLFGRRVRRAGGGAGDGDGGGGGAARRQWRSLLSAIEFGSLDLPEPLVRGIRDAGFVTATAIQEAALPLALKGKDVAGQSQTGTGKTAAFLIAAFTRCLRTPSPTKTGVTAPRVLIIAPTRELVVQIEADAHLLGAHTGLRIISVYGGIDYNKQREALRDGADVLVGTPGPPHRLSEAARLVAEQGRGAGHRRGRPDVRHGLHRGSPLHPAEAAQAGAEAVVPVFGDAVLPGDGADVGVHEQPRPDHDHPQSEDGGKGRAGALPRGARGEVQPAPRPAQARRGQPHPHLLQYAGGGAPPRGPSRPQWLAGARPHGRRGPEEAAEAS